MSKSKHSGGFELTLETAKRLAVQEFGTAKGLEPDRSTCLDGYFRMEMGNLIISIHPDLSGCIKVITYLVTSCHRCIGYYDRETLEPDYDVMGQYERQKQREEQDMTIKKWVCRNGPSLCRQLIDKIWTGDA